MMSRWHQVATKPAKASQRGFQDAILVWLRKPHVINKRLCTAKILSEETVHITLHKLETISELAKKYNIDQAKLHFIQAAENDSTEVGDGHSEPVTTENDSTEVGDSHSEPVTTENDSTEVGDSHSEPVTTENDSTEVGDSHSEPVTTENDSTKVGDGHSEPVTTEMTVTVRALLPKQPDKFPILEETVFMVPDHQVSVFIPSRRYMECDGREHGTMQDDVPYMFTQQPETASISLSVFGPDDKDMASTPTNQINCSLEWLEGVLLTKIARWSEEKGLNTEVTSLKLIPIDRYNQIYQELKTKYGKPLAKIWPESTDPQKFVFEDVAIASYLLTLWECERMDQKTEQRQSFVDLGCGNGLLVYLLTAEGHKGIGIDVRKRKIWDLYGDKADLREGSITPSDDCLFPEYDWLIGNHSDELTPWIPVIAARSSYNTRYFVLPCCLWDFTSKYTDKSRGISQYQTYLGYVREVGEVCGFSVQQDVLRIPSTKRVCLIGGSRTYPSSEETEVDTRRRQFITTRCQHNTNMPPSSGVKDTQPLSIGETEGLSSGPHSLNDRETDTLPPGVKETHQLVDTAVNNGASSIIHSQDSEQCNDSLVPHHKRAKMSHVTDSQHARSQYTTSDKPTTSNSSKHGVMSETQTTEVAKSWSADFMARQEDTRPRNCVQVDRKVKDTIIDTVFKAILDDQDGQILELSNGKTWRKGGRLPLSSVAAMFDKSTLAELKDECGGLQTLLRNCHHIFMVQGGHVELRDWVTTDQSKRLQDKRKRKGQKNNDSEKLLKTKRCYFHDNHPDGCPLVAEKCRFAHGSDELVSVNFKTKTSAVLHQL